MNTTERTPSNRSTEIHPIFAAVVLVIALSLLLSFVACSSLRNPSSKAPDEATSAPPLDTSYGTEQSPADEPIGSTDDPTANADRDLLAYYVSLVDELQLEVQKLKTENFILSASQNTSSDVEVSTSPERLYTYEEKNGTITILSYTGSAKDVTVPESIDGYPVTRIGENAFAGTKVVSVTLPGTVLEIDWFAFSGCSALKRVSAGETVKTVGYGAFDGCPSSLTLVCPENSYLSKYGKSFGIAVSQG